jgi:hypothetical protein
MTTTLRLLDLRLHRREEILPTFRPVDVGTKPEIAILEKKALKPL